MSYGTNQQGFLKNQDQTKLSDLKIKDNEEQKNNIQDIYNQYENLKNGLEYKKIFRVIIAIAIPMILFFAFFATQSEFKIKEVPLILLCCLIMSILDIVIHTILYTFTLNKNIEESIKLEEWFKNKIK